MCYNYKLTVWIVLQFCGLISNPQLLLNAALNIYTYAGDTQSTPYERYIQPWEMYLF